MKSPYSTNLTLANESNLPGSKLPINNLHLINLLHSSDNITKTITAINGEEIKFVYSLSDKKMSAGVIEGETTGEKTGVETNATEFTEKLQKTAKLIKHEDLPKEIAAVKDPVTFHLLYARTSYLSNRDVKLYVEQRELGGGKEDRESGYRSKMLDQIRGLATKSYEEKPMRRMAGNTLDKRLQSLRSLLISYLVNRVSGCFYCLSVK